MRTGRVAAAALAAWVALAGAAWAQGGQGPQRIGMAEFKKLHQENAVVVVDVRDAESYAVGHIPGALSVPEDQLKQHLATLKDVKKPIVAYCA